MRPTNIRISGFGPYAGNVDLPMDRLGESGLYLITGDTGAGKTSIFDAICYALYGEPSGGNREVYMLRSLYAAPDTPTEVELAFLHAGREYRVKRSPEYQRPKRKGEGTTKHIAEAEMQFPDGKVITGKDHVTAAVKQLLGIDKTQFMQIVMLAQGEFMKLLTADTTERSKIFRGIFKTDRYLSLQDMLEAARKETRTQVDAGRKSVEQFIAGILADADDVLSADAERAKKGQMTTEDVIELLERLIAQDSTRREQLDRELEEVNRALGGVNARLGAAEVLENARRAIGQAKTALEKEAPALKEMQKTLEEAGEALKEKAGLDKEAARIDSELAGYDRTDRLEKELGAAVAKSRKNGEELRKLEAAQKEQTARLEEMKQELAAIRDSGEESAKLAAKRAQLAEALRQLEELGAKLREYAATRGRLERAQETYRQADAGFREKNSAYEELDQTGRDAQAGVLAERLIRGQPCPVCGSTDHPHPAHYQGKIPTEQELEDAKAEAGRAREQREQAARNAAGLREKTETLEDGVRRELKRQLDSEEPDRADLMIDGKKGELTAECERIDARTAVLEEAGRRKAELEKRIPGLEKTIAETAERIGACNKEKAAVETEIREKTAQLAEWKKGLRFESKEAAAAGSLKLHQRAEKLQNDYDRAGKAVSAQMQKITGLKETIRTQQETIDRSEVRDVAEDRELQTRLNEKQKWVVEDSRSVGTRIAANRGIMENIRKKSGEITAFETRLQWLSALTDTASGKLAGKDKVTLEAYIQTMYFDRIIKRANLRMLKMSGGQYELKRAGEAQNKRDKSGLELNVIDHGNGTERSVRSLSGGESFLASLSLALGLSDEVQSSAGGIRVDTMFVDEGFGSLDHELLDTAYRALSGLTESSRLVGIISHVAELKNRIDRQIVVTKARSGGSKAEIVV